MTLVLEALATATWAALLPPHRSAGDDTPVGRPVALDALPLGPDRWLAIVGDEAGQTYPVPMVDDDGALRRARPGEGAGEALLTLLGDGTRRIGNFSVTRWHTEPVAGERAIEVDQTNESIVVGSRAVLKWSFRAEEGPHPAVTLWEQLERQSFRGSPAPWGLVEWHPPAGAAPRLVASAVSLLPGATDGWTWAVDDLRVAVVLGDQAVAAGAGTELGGLVARFHLALAGTGRPAGPGELRRLRADAESDLTQALEVTRGRAHDVLATHAPAVRAVLDRLPFDHTTVMRVHGDLHVGQVLRYFPGPDPGYVLTDFDGSPVMSPADRVRPHPAALDVAGMLQSLQHVAVVLRRHEPERDAVTTTRMVAALGAAFLDRYRETLTDAGHAALLDERLMLPLRVRQLCREFTYAATHLSRWSYVPEAALPALLAGTP